MRSGQLTYRRFYAPVIARKRRKSAWQSEFCIGVGPHISVYGPTTSAHEPAPLSLSPTSGASARRKRMSDQVTNKSAAAVGVVETALPFSTPPSYKMLSRITILLFILVAGFLTGVRYYASSICITRIPAGVLAILFDPVVIILEKLHLPRSVAAAGIVLAGMSLVGLLGYVLYGKAMSFAEELPVYASKVQQTVEPISKKIQTFQQSAGNLANDVHVTKKVPEVRLQQSPTWPDYLVRGVGSVWGALIIAGVVPFLTFFMLCTKDQMAIRMDGLFGSRIDAARFITNLNKMIRGFVAGNLIVGSVMAMATTLVLWSLGMKGAIPLGVASGLLNLLPFLGLIAALALPLAAALLQFNTLVPFIVIILTILFLHVVSANLLIPKFIATRVSIWTCPLNPYPITEGIS